MHYADPSLSLDSQGVARHPPFRVGLIGYGFAAKTFHAPLIAAEFGLTLTTVFSSDRAKVIADLPHARVDGDPFAVATSDEIDLVVIASPNDSHAPLARAALRAGKHVVVDKPFTLDMAEARELIALADEHQRLLSVFHNRRWDSDFLSVKAAIADGLVGTVAHFESHIDRFRPEVRARWRESGGPGSGVWFDLGPHLVDQALQLFGLPVSVHALLALQRKGAQADDWAHVLLDYGPRRVILHASMLVAGGSPRFIVHGDKGSLVKRLADPQEQQLLDGIKPGAPGWGEDTDGLLIYDETGAARSRPSLPGDQRRYYAAIAAALAGRPVNPVPPLEALAVMSIMEAAIESARRGRAIAPDLSDQERASWT
ncbi:Predicted dehydrogenase [Novosphingobium sp. CF614]|uniref:oxidoreductase n=1 Tax=Novosphingobium sp. CF614 TaxID=1884364 RepID=UPI0008E9EC1B|nr:oxidoreductase [Novosphingobium sp. CF614]SFG50740.1 Predicted dehydrogenase [Novosphingobium sp. CF614]